MEKRYLTVTALNRYIKAKIDQDNQLQHILIKGEISNFKHHSSGHLYFTLKDENSRINAVMFSSKAKNLAFVVENGMKVLVEGSVSVYDIAGTYQIYVNSLEQDGIGNLFLQFEKLKKQLAKEGLFEDTHKMEIPRFPSKIAVLSAYPSAALMDILRTIRLRFPVVRVVVFPIPVQGKEAYKEMIRTLQYVDEMHFSTILLARGGGSLEDLWNFNEEALARTVYSCKTPIISGVGHEVDFTICDFVADYRAATPTAAAIKATPDILELRQNVNNVDYTLQSLMQQKLAICKEQLERRASFYLFKNPDKLFEDRRMLLAYKQDQLASAYNTYLKVKKQSYETLGQTFRHQIQIFSLQQNNILENMKKELEKSFQLKIKRNEEKFYFLISKLNTLSPLKTLERGYAIVLKEDTTICSKEMLQSGDRVKIKLKDGQVDAIIE